MALSIVIMHSTISVISMHLKRDVKLIRLLGKEEKRHGVLMIDLNN